MLIYSQWRPDGGYDYFESNETAPLGDDLGVPSLHVVNGIGVPSVEAGRPLSRAARHVGSGDLARGVIAPMQKGRVSGIAFLDAMPSWAIFLSGATVASVAWWLWSKKR